MKRLTGARSLCLDAYGTNRSGKKYDLEIQRADKGTGPHRARYHSSVMDIENLDTGQAFVELPDTYAIFIVEKDFYGIEKPVYPIERINLATGRSFEDGAHILYVNGEYRGDSEIGKLMHDFNCTDADQMNFALMAERTRYLKENPKGVSEMCKVLEDMCVEERAQERKEAMIEVAIRMIEAEAICVRRNRQYFGPLSGGSEEALGRTKRVSKTSNLLRKHGKPGTCKQVPDFLQRKRLKKSLINCIRRYTKRISLYQHKEQQNRLLHKI